MTATVDSAARAETLAREEIATTGHSLFSRGLTFGATGNISVRLEDERYIVTPTGVSMGALDPAELSVLNATGSHVSGAKPTKETFLHMAMYEARTNDRAIVHLHSTHSVAVSCLADIDETDVLPPLTAYFIMRVGKLPLVAYFPPGDTALAKAVGKLAGDHHAVLLANHGPVVSGDTLQNATFATEELEETARLFLMLQGMKTRPLTKDQVDELRERFPT